MKPNTLLETIRCQDGVLLHLAYHQQRLEASLKTLGNIPSLHLSQLITPPDKGVYRCRFLYDGSDSYSVEYLPYVPRHLHSLRLVFDDTIEYPLKYADRHAINALYEQREACDDILIVKQGLLTDTSIGNIALFIEGRWLTPIHPLLPGTTRARLIQEGVIFPATLQVDDIAKAKKVAMMNAMVGFVEIENGIIT